jgi:hypothetical protein
LEGLHRHLQAALADVRRQVVEVSLVEREDVGRLTGAGRRGAIGRADSRFGGGLTMADAIGGSWGWARRWPRYVGAILLAAAAQSGLGAWVVSGDAEGVPIRLQIAAYLAGCAATAGVIGPGLCLAPLPVGRSGSQDLNGRRSVAGGTIAAGP